MHYFSEMYSFLIFPGLDSNILGQSDQNLIFLVELELIVNGKLIQTFYCVLIQYSSLNFFKTPCHQVIAGACYNKLFLSLVISIVELGRSEINTTDLVLLKISDL
jgi:hypothetical protein